MNIIKKIMTTMIILTMTLLAGNLSAKTTHSFIEVEVDKSEKKYAASLVLENAGIEEIIKILSEYTGAEIKISKPPAKNKRLTVEFHFDDKRTPGKLVWYGTKATVKTYIIREDTERVPVQTIKTYVTPGGKEKKKQLEVHINSKADSQSRIDIKIGEKINVNYKNIKLEDLLDRFSGFGKVKFRLDPNLKKKNIRVNLTMHNFKAEDALKALASLENLVLKKLDKNLYLVIEKKK